MVGLLVSLPQLLVGIAKWNLYVQWQYILVYQMLETNHEGELFLTLSAEYLTLALCPLNNICKIVYILLRTGH